MLTYVRGDLVDAALLGQVDGMIHGCNCFCTMGSGIARDVHEKIPSAFEADKTTIPGERSKMGKYTLAKIIAATGKPVFVINAYTQYTYWDTNDMFSLAALRSALASVKFTYNNKAAEPIVIGIPLLGAGLAKGNWAEIANEIANMNFSESNITIAVFVKFKKDWDNIVVKAFPNELSHIDFSDLTIIN